MVFGLILVIGTALLTIIPYINCKDITIGLIEEVKVHLLYRGKGIGRKIQIYDLSRIEALNY